MSWEIPLPSFLMDCRAADSQINNPEQQRASLQTHSMQAIPTTHTLKQMKMWKPGRFKSKCHRNGSRRPLLENNNNNIQDGYEQVGYDNPASQNTFNTLEEQRARTEEQIKLQEFAELLCVAPDANTSEDGSCCSEPDSGQQHFVHLIQKSVRQHFPEKTADVHQHLHQHLVNVQETVRNELVRLGPVLESMGLMGCLIDCYHRQTFDRLDYLLQNISSPQNSFVLMKWVLHTYWSQELFGHPDLLEMDPIKKDTLLFTEWVEKAKYKLLEIVQKEVRGYLDEILQNERGNEAYDELYVDTIQCISAMPKEAHKISPTLSDYVQEVCFKELLIFLDRYTAEQTEMLGKKAEMDKPETKHFFKTLNNCKEIKQYVQTKAKSTLLKETVATLEDMEAFTLKLLMEIMADIAERHLKKYFKSENREFFLLIEAVQSHFSELSCCQDIQKRVMDEAYKLIAHIYLKHLIRSSQSKLRRCWSPDVGHTVAEDAELLHIKLSDLVPGVQQWNLMLLKVTELLECKSIDATKITAASMQKECRMWREDLELLPALLRWKGLSGRQVREVLQLLEDLPGYEPRPRSVSCLSCLTCW